MKAEPTTTLKEAPVEPQLPQLPQLDEHTPVTEIKREEITDLSPGQIDGPSKPKKTKSALDNLFGDVFITKVEPSLSLLDRIQIELKNYMKEPVIPLSAAPLLWWKLNCHKCPLIAKAARIILCVPATSVPSERVFSTARDIVTAQRASLSPDNVDALIFLKKNMYVQIRRETKSDE